jgi:hypothetical protein
MAGRSASGLALPGTSDTAWRLGLAPVLEPSAWLENVVAVYLIAREYLEPLEATRGRVFDRAEWIAALLAQHSQLEYLHQLAALNHAALHEELTLQYQERFLNQVEGDAGAVIRRAVAGGVDGRPRRFLARQVVLRALHLVLVPPARDPSRAPDPAVVAALKGFGPEAAAVLLVHLAADALTQEQRSDGPRFGSAPEALARELIANNLFNEQDDDGDLMARYRLLWREYGPRLRKYALRQPPDALLQNVTQLEFDDMTVLGFAYYAHARMHRPGNPVAINARIAPELTIDPAAIERFLDLFATTLPHLENALRECPEPWQVRPLQERPLLRIDENVLILDERFLLERVTRGLYWLVHDVEKRQSETARIHWTQAYGEMIEIRAEDQLRRMAPPLVLGTDSTFFTEEDLLEAFPETKNCDAGIDFGNDVVLAEIVSGTVKTTTRELADLDSFRKDTEKIVLKKARQLDAAATSLLRDPQPAKSPLLAPARRIFPVVICGGQFPVNPVTIRYINERVATEGLLRDSRVQPLTLLDLECLEACESLQSHKGTTFPLLLEAWIRSPYREASFRSYLASQYGGQDIGRPTDISDALAEVFSALDRRFPGLR